MGTSRKQKFETAKTACKAFGHLALYLPNWEVDDRLT